MIYSRTILDTRKEKSSGIYTVKIRITCNREQKYYLTGYQMTKSDFEEVMKNVPPKRLQDIRIQLDHLELRAKTIISKLDAFSFRSFEEKFYGNKNAAKSIYDMYTQIIDHKMSDGKISTAINYRCSMKSLKKFAPKLSFIDITPSFLKSYEKHLLQEEKSISTVGIYIRPLRAILNEAINNKYLPRDNYPFGLKKYIIPESRNIKRALSKEDFRKIIQYIPEKEDGFEARAKDFWVLSYLCQGMNPKDLLLLRKENVEGDIIKFIRQKTKDTTRSCITEITVPLLPETIEIINKWKSKKEDSNFLFEFVDEAMTPLEVYKTVQQFVKTINKHMDKIAQNLSIQNKVTCYVARFQFTKALIDADVSLEYLRQCLGHANSVTTQRYIGSFENTKKHEIARKHLLNFN